MLAGKDWKDFQSCLSIESEYVRPSAAADYWLVILLVEKDQQVLKAFNCAGFDDASLNCSSWVSISGLRGRRRTYLTILKRAWSANLKMAWYILLRPLRPELDGRPSFSWSNNRKHHQNQHNCRPLIMGKTITITKINICNHMYWEIALDLSELFRWTIFVALLSPFSLLHCLLFFDTFCPPRKKLTDSNTFSNWAECKHPAVSQYDHVGWSSSLPLSTPS
jgi:hypothetical protein